MPIPESNAKQFSVTLTDGARLAVTAQGTGKALLCISGLGGTAGFWNPCIPALATTHQTICLDQRGIAGSTRGTAACTIDQLAEDCFTVLDACGIDSAVVLGHSTGGCIAQTMSLTKPARVQSLILSATWARPTRYMQELFKLRLALLENNPVQYASSAVFLSYESSWLNANWSVYESALAGAPRAPAVQQIIQERISALIKFDRKAELAQLTMPCLILGARDDLMIPSFLQEELAISIPGAELRLLNYGGHFFPITYTENFLQEITSWLSTHTNLYI
ncbi:MAG: alpha/beta hydrolase [Sheuella sp.]|nr:alpha/beta hydrolase [Sheuella sp.]